MAPARREAAERRDTGAKPAPGLAACARAPARVLHAQVPPRPLVSHRGSGQFCRPAAAPSRTRGRALPPPRSTLPRARAGRSHSAMSCRIVLLGDQGDRTSRRTLRSARSGLKTVLFSFGQALVLMLVLARSGVLPGVCAMPVQPLLEVPQNAAIYGGRKIECPIVDAPARQLATYRMPPASHGWRRHHTAGTLESARAAVGGCTGGGGQTTPEAGRHARAASPLRLAGGWWGSGSAAAAGEGGVVAGGGGGVENGVYRTLATAGHMHMSFYGFMCDLRATSHTPP
jgi:hypothetical protein